MARRPNIDDLIESWDPVLRKAFIDSVLNVRDKAQLDKLVEAIQENDVDKALRAIGLDPVSFRAFDKTLAQAFEAGGTNTAGKLPTVKLEDGFRVNFEFNVRNPDAEKWLRDRSSSKVTQILDDQRTLIRNHLRVGIAAGDNPRTTALDLVGRVGQSGRRENGLIGLTTSQAEWVRNYEAALRSDAPTDALRFNLRDRRFDKMVERGNLSAEDVTKMVNAYQNRALRFRAESIARTETMAAVNEAQAQAVRQAIQTGALDRRAVVKVWRATKDKRTRDSHRHMDGQTVAFDDKFQTGNGNFLDHPGDPNGPPEEVINCRCWMETKVDFLAGIE